ncbi:MAG: lipopolysaccharide biosynthesis protein [Lachnospiraceae bacterium]|nr:lipopolysaccharide biosynthesis protein [Lachnospiraceae bacterium]
MKKDYISNTIAGLINAGEAVIISMIITRTTGLADAGYVTIAFAVGNLLMTIGKYGVYGFQVTDRKGIYPFSVYLKTRIITVSAMLLSLAGYLVYGHYVLGQSRDKMYIILFIGLIYAIEAFEDLIKAHCQYVGRLYVGALMFIIRWSAIMITFAITLIITRSTPAALGYSLAVSLITFIICYYLFIIRNRSLYFPEPDGDVRAGSGHPGVINLLKDCLPLFLSLFLSFYIVNSSKYAIEKYMDAEAQACFGFVAMPVFVIELLNCFIYQPQLASLTDDHNSPDNTRFKSRILKQYLIILILTVLCLTGAYFIGIPFLSALYDTDLYSYRNELLILLTGGGFLAVSGFQNAILTIMRRQKYLLWGYLPVSVLAFFFVDPAVKKYGTIGAAFSYLSLIAILCILYEYFIRRRSAGDS